MNIETMEPKKTKRTRVKPEPLPKLYNESAYSYEIGIDEAGRGPLFGRVYVAGVVLPKTMDTTEIRDSKKLSAKKLQASFEYIKQEALAYHVAFIEAEEIDRINIREAVMKVMHICAGKCIEMLENAPKEENKEDYFLCVDGNDFPPYYYKNCRISWQTFTSGDNRFAHIAAASILAKVSRDNYILDLCKERPCLSEIYGMDKHKGYGTKQHIEAIRNHGIVEGHRVTFRKGNLGSP